MYREKKSKQNKEGNAIRHANCHLPSKICKQNPQLKYVFVYKLINNDISVLTPVYISSKRTTKEILI
jgi:hypothetical protein